MGATVSGISQSREVKTNMPENDNKAPKRTPSSMSMIEPRFRNIYKRFYKETYYTPTTLDLKTKELIAIGCSLIAKCEGCLEGHIKKALELGLTRNEISDAIVVAVGIAAAGVVDFSDKAAKKLDLHHFEEEPGYADQAR
jgi:AhpD family alkylhydroperoxidase